MQLVDSEVSEDKQVLISLRMGLKKFFELTEKNRECRLCNGLVETEVHCLGECPERVISEIFLTWKEKHSLRQALLVDIIFSVLVCANMKRPSEAP
jgi:hypothetical protein